MKNIILETEDAEWREKITRAFERIKKLTPNHVIVALVIAEKVDDPMMPMSLSVHANTCGHITADLLKIGSLSLTAAAHAKECEPHSQN